jgi:neurofibromin 1
MQWKNLTLFLAAFSGVCVQENHDPSALTSILPTQYLPDEMRVLQNPVTMVSTFITDLTDLLIAESAQVREVARDALGTELNPRLYGRLFRHLEELVITNSPALPVTYALDAQSNERCN